MRSQCETGMWGAFLPQAHVFTQQPRNNCLTENPLNGTVFWVQRRLVRQKLTARFGATRRSHFQGRRVSKKGISIASGRQLYLLPASGWGERPLSTAATNWPTVPARDDSSRWNEKWQGKTK